MTETEQIMRAEALAARLVLAFDADDYGAYHVALFECASDCRLNDGVLATLVHTLCVALAGHPGWQARTQAQLAGLLDELASG